MIIIPYILIAVAALFFSLRSAGPKGGKPSNAAIAVSLILYVIIAMVAQWLAAEAFSPPPFRVTKFDWWLSDTFGMRIGDARVLRDVFWRTAGAAVGIFVANLMAGSLVPKPVGPSEDLHPGMVGGSLDIRTPMGLMFSVLGVIITVYGAVTHGNKMYEEHSLGININFWWGLALTVFGVAMLAPAMLKSRKSAAVAKEAKPPQDQGGAGH